MKSLAPKPTPTPPVPWSIDRQQATVQHYPFIRHIARRLTRRLPTYLALDDIIAAGMVGLMESINRYDPSKSDSFNSFAEFRIKGAILDTLRESDYLSREQRTSFEAIKKARQDLIRQLGREPEPEELAQAVGCDLEQYYELTTRAAAQRSKPIGEQVTSTDLLEHQGTSQLADGNRAELKTLLMDAVDRLPERLQRIISLLYFKDMNLKEIGEILGVTESRVCQLHIQAVQLLRDSFLAE